MPVLKRMLFALGYVCRMHRKTEGRNQILTPISAISNEKVNIKTSAYTLLRILDSMWRLFSKCSHHFYGYAFSVTPGLCAP